MSSSPSNDVCDAPCWESKSGALGGSPTSSFPPTVAGRRQRNWWPLVMLCARGLPDRLTVSSRFPPSLFCSVWSYGRHPHRSSAPAAAAGSAPASTDHPQPHYLHEWARLLVPVRLRPTAVDLVSRGAFPTSSRAGVPCSSPPVTLPTWQFT